MPKTKNNTSLSINFDPSKLELKNPLWWANVLTTFLTALYLLFVPISFLTRYADYEALNPLIGTFVYVILVSFLQLFRVLLGGEKFFPKVPFDIALLIIPPAVIIVSLITSDGDLFAFGDQYRWFIAPINIMVGVMLAYLIGMNFKNKKGEVFVSKSLWIGLLFLSLVYFLLRGSASWDLESLGIPYLMLISLPVILFQLIKHKGRFRIIYLLLTIIGFWIFKEKVYELGDKWDGQVFETGYVPFVLPIVMLYDILALVLLGLFFKRINFNIIKYFKNINKEMDATIKGSLGRDFKALLVTNYDNALAFIGILFVVITTLWLFLSNLLPEFIRLWWGEITLVTEIEGIKRVLLGQHLVVGSNSFISLIFAYGLIVSLIIFGVMGLILVSKIRDIANDHKNNIENSKFIYLIELILLSGFSLFFNPTVLMYIFFWVFTGLLLISSRDEEVTLNSTEIFRYDKLKDSQMAAFYRIFRILGLIILICALIVILRGLNNLVSQGVFLS